MSERGEETMERPSDELAARIVTMRDGGMSWAEIQQQLGLTRQQARYAYQLGKRAQRRSSRRDRANRDIRF